MRFPIQVVAKSRTPQDHLSYYRWVRFVNGDYHRQTGLGVVGFRFRWFITFMDLMPPVIWRRLPVRWQVAHLYGDLE